MNLTARHRWCAERILFCFNPSNNNREDANSDELIDNNTNNEGNNISSNNEVNESKVTSFVRKPKIYAKFNDFFEGQSPAALFVHYQPRHVELEFLEKDADGKQMAAKKSELFVSYGDTTLMNSKCCYFLRVGDSVDTSVANDTSLLYGEMSESPLETIKSLLSSTYAPLFAQSSEWGNTNEEQKADFNEEMNKFVRNLTSAVQSISGGLELRHLESSHIKSLESSSSSSSFNNGGGGGSIGQMTTTTTNPEAISNLEELLAEWSSQIEEFTKSSENNNTSSSSSNSIEQLEGPKGEIEHWRARTQHLSSIIEQLKRKDCRYVVGVLSSYTKGTNDPAKQKTIGLLRRWKQIDVETTEAINEAKDNLKYLSTLQRFIQPLYSGTAQSIIDTLPALINSIKVCCYSLLL